MGRSKSRTFIDATKLSLSEWLEHINVPDFERRFTIVDYRFPTDTLREEYLSIVHGRPESEIKNVLRGFLIPSGSLGTDSHILRTLTAMSNNRLAELMDECEFVRRLFSRRGSWEGVTWVLDLIPDRPRKALDALDAYFSAHVSFLPDGRMDGLEDAEAVIRERYFYQGNPRDVLLGLRPTEFEFLVAALFEKIGFSVSVTQTTYDGGIDVVAKNTERARATRILIQCKRHTANVPVTAVRELMGIVSSQRANKGILVATSDFTAQAKKEARSTSMIEVVSFKDLNILMNEHFGSKWPTFVTYHIRNMQHKLAKAVVSSGGVNPSAL
jgi:restriction system protein